MKLMIASAPPICRPTTLIGAAICGLVSVRCKARELGDWPAERQLTMALEALLDMQEMPSELPTQPNLTPEWAEPTTGVRLRADVQPMRKAR